MDVSNGGSYPMAPTMVLDRPDQLQAIGHELRAEILVLLSERAASTKQLAEALDRPPGTVGHHLKVLESAGLVAVVRTRQVRAVTEKFYGRTAGTFILTAEGGKADGVDALLDRIRAEAIHDPDRHLGATGTVRYARIPQERVDEWMHRIAQIGAEFATQPAGGEVVWGLALTMFPTARRALEPEDEST